MARDPLQTIQHLERMAADPRTPPNEAANAHRKAQEMRAKLPQQPPAPPPPPSRPIPRYTAPRPRWEDQAADLDDLLKGDIRFRYEDIMRAGQRMTDRRAAELAEEIARNPGAWGTFSSDIESMGWKPPPRPELTPDQARIAKLEALQSWLTPSDQISAGSLLQNWRTRRMLSIKQWEWVDDLIRRGEARKHP